MAQASLQGVNGFCLVLAVISFVFFLVSCIGYTAQQQTLTNVPWIVATNAANNKVYFGLRAYYDPGVDGFFGAWGDEDCPFIFCDECTRDGNAALGLLLVALLFSFIEALLCSTFVFTESLPGQLNHVVVTLIAAVFSLVAITLFMGSCYGVIKVDTTYDLHWAASSILAILGMLLMWVSVASHILGALLISRNIPVPTSNV